MLIDASINSASTMSDSSARSESSRANPRDEVELVDTHAHLNFDAFKKDADEVIRRCLDEGVWMINVGSHYKASKRAVEIAEKYREGIYAAIGLHPINLDTGLLRTKADNIEGSHFEKEFDYEKYKELAKSQKVIAIGEIGLDYYWRPKTTAKKELFKQKQKNLFLEELKLAEELNLPVIFHCRMAHDDLINIISEQLKNNNKQIRGVIHCFTGTWEQAQKYMEMGLALGFNGLIFKLDFKDIIQKTPLERILIETDCPYLSPPASLREQALPEMLSLQAGRLRSVAGGTSPENNTNYRNEPIYVKYIAKEIAKIKNIKFEEVSKITNQNAKELFKF